MDHFCFGIILEYEIFKGYRPGFYFQFPVIGIHILQYRQLEFPVSPKIQLQNRFDLHISRLPVQIRFNN